MKVTKTPIFLPEQGLIVWTNLINHFGWSIMRKLQAI